MLLKHLKTLGILFALILFFSLGTTVLAAGHTESITHVVLEIDEHQVIFTIGAYGSTLAAGPGDPTYDYMAAGDSLVVQAVRSEDKFIGIGAYGVAFAEEGDTAGAIAAAPAQEQEVINNYLVFDGFDGEGQPILSLLFPERFTHLKGTDTETLVVEFSDDVSATGLEGDASGWNELAPAAIAAAVDTDAEKILFLDTFFTFMVHQEGDTVPMTAADLDAAYNPDWDKITVSGASDSFSVQIEANFLELSYDLDQGNTAVTRMNAKWVGSQYFAGFYGAVVNDPDPSSFKIQYESGYSDEAGTDYTEPTTVTFVAHDAPLVRPFITGVKNQETYPFGTTLAPEFTGTGELFKDGASLGGFDSGTEITEHGEYQLVVTDDTTSEGNTTVYFNIEVEELVVVGVQAINDMTVDFGTSFAALPLPEKVEVILSDNSTTDVDVDWTGAEQNYDGDTADTYTLEGELELPEGIINPDDLKAEVGVIVDPVEVEVVTGIESNLGELDFGGIHFFEDDGVGEPVAVDADSVTFSFDENTGTLTLENAWIHLSTLQVVNIVNKGDSYLELQEIKLLDADGNDLPEAHLSNYGMAYNMYDGALHGGFPRNTSEAPFFFAVGDQIAPGEIAYGILSAHIQEDAVHDESYVFDVELVWEEVPVISVAEGQLLDAEAGTDFTGALYTRDGNLYYNQQHSDGNWGSETLIGEGTEGRMVIDDNGNPHVAYVTETPSEYDAIGYRKFDGTEWTVEELIQSNGDANCSKPDIAVDSDGYAHITYTDPKGANDRWNDIMYATNSTGTFEKTLIKSGYYDRPFFDGMGDYYEKGSYITVDSDNNYYIMIHHRKYTNPQGFPAYSDYRIIITSDSGDYTLAGFYSSDVVDIFDFITEEGKLYPLFRDETVKTAELTTSEGEIASKQDKVVVNITSAYSHQVNQEDVVIGSKTGDNLQVHYNDIPATFPEVEIEGNAVSIVNLGGTFYAVYTDKADNIIKTLELEELQDLSGFELAMEADPITEGDTTQVNITNAKNVAGDDIDGTEVAVTVTSDQAEGVVFNDNVDFSDPAGEAEIITSALTSVGEHTLTVSVDGVTDDETVTVTVIDNTMQAEVESALDYEYDPPYEYCDVEFDETTNTYTGTYTQEQFNDEDPMNDLGRYLGALYRQADSTIIEIEYDGTVYTWNEDGELVGSNWEDAAENTLVSAMVADYLAAPNSLTVKVSNGVHFLEVTFVLIVVV